MTRFAAIPLFGVALTLGAFGVIRGATPAGPAAGVRLVLAIAPPVSEDARAMAAHAAKERVNEKGMDTRVVEAGDQLVVEIGETDPMIVGEMTELLTRTATLELHVVMPNDSWPAADYVANDPHAKDLGIRVAQGAVVGDDRDSELAVADADAIGCRGRVEDGKRHCVVRGDQVLASYIAAIPTLAVPHGHTLAFGRIPDRVNDRTWTTYLLDDRVLVAGREIQRVELGDHGVIADVTAEAARRVAAQASTRPGAPLAVVFDGKVKAVVPLPPAAPEPALHLHTTGAADVVDDAAVGAALDLQIVLEAGAMHPLTVLASTPFTRAVGFFPRAWLFLALALVSLVAGALVWRRRA